MELVQVVSTYMYMIVACAYFFCKDKPKYGGPGKRKQCCELRKCIKISRKCQVNATSPKLEEIIQPSLQSNSSPVTISTISTYLMHSGRKMHPIVGDGNCLFIEQYHNIMVY